MEGRPPDFLSGCCTVPPYHKHPHDPAEETEWLKGDFREQTERTFQHIGEVLTAGGASFKNVLKLNIFVTQMDGQNILNEISARHFGPHNPPARTLVGVPTLAHPGMLIEIDGVAAAPANRSRRASRAKAVALLLPYGDDAGIVAAYTVAKGGDYDR